MHGLIVNKHEQQKQRVVLEKRYKLPKRNIYKMVTLSIQFSKYSFFFAHIHILFEEHLTNFRIHLFKPS